MNINENLGIITTATAAMNDALRRMHPVDQLRQNLEAEFHEHRRRRDEAFRAIKMNFPVTNPYFTKDNGTEDWNE